MTRFSASIVRRAKQIPENRRRTSSFVLTHNHSFANIIHFTKMAWRQQGSTGSNNIPLGNKRRFGGAGESASPQHDSNGYQGPGGGSDGGFKRGRSPVRCKFTTSHGRKSTTDSSVAEDPSGDGTRRRKKRNRWGDATDNKAAGLMGLPTAIMANMTSEQLEAYTLHLRIEEISQKLRIEDVVPADGDR